MIAGPVDTTSGSLTTPPNEYQPPQLPLNDRLHSAPSRPRMKTSSRPGATDTPPGPPTSPPPSGCHAPNDVPPSFDCRNQRAPSEPRPNTSMTPLDDATAS